MGRAEAGTPKAIANQQKSRGLQKLRFYCQVCEKQCRDENGFKCHTQTEGHLRQMLVVGENAGKYIADYSAQFQSDFIALLSRRWGTKKVRINAVYQDYIANKTHLHMNATRFTSLTEFTKHLGRTSVCHVEESEERGWEVSWIDTSAKAISKSQAGMKKEREDVDDETRQRKLIQEQIARARKDAIKRRVESEGGVFDEEAFERNGGNIGIGADPAGVEGAAAGELKRVEGDAKVSLSLSFKSTSAPVPSPPLASTSTSPPVTATSVSITPAVTIIPSLSFKPTVTAFKPAQNAFKAGNPLKRPNPLKSSSSSTSSAGPTKRVSSNVESIIREETARRNYSASVSSSRAGAASSSGEIDWDRERGLEGARAREDQSLKRGKYAFRG